LKVTALILGIVFFALMVSLATFGQNVEISIPASSGAPGSTVTIPVNISDTTGMEVIAVGITLQYDPQILSAIDADVSGTIAGTWQVISNTTIPGEVAIRMMWSEPPTGHLSGSGTLVNIRFLVQPAAQIDSTCQLHFVEVLLNETTPDVIRDGIFTVAHVSPEARMEGDVNGDNCVDYRDLLKLVLMYKKKSGDSGYDPSADFNDDGSIDLDDMIVLWRNFGAAKG
jgi:hypothetical protein